MNSYDNTSPSSQDLSVPSTVMISLEPILQTQPSAMHTGGELEEKQQEMHKKLCMDSHERHFTKEAQDYQLQECVSNTMKKMSKNSSCVKYMSGILALGSEPSSCTINQLGGFCEKSRETFTVEDAKNWCLKKNEATTSFWKQKFQH